MMNLLELYAGSRSVGKSAEKLGMRVFSVDIEPFPGVDLVKDIEELTLADLPFVPDVVWASPPCTSYSIAAISHYRNGIFPKNDFARKSDRLIIHTLELFKHFENQANNGVGGGTLFFRKPCRHVTKNAFHEKPAKGYGVLLPVRRQPNETYGYLEQPHKKHFQYGRVAAAAHVLQRQQNVPP